jgi:hypothetical protein
MKKNYIKLNTKKSEIYTHNSMVLLLLVLSISLVLFVGCQNKQKTSNDFNVENSQVIDSKTVYNDNKYANTLVEPTGAEVIPNITQNRGGDNTLEFSELSKYHFVFSSGAGAWQTALNINEDGTFKGYFLDSNMGDIDEGYPIGMAYSSTFEGKFTTPNKVNDYTYSMSIESIKLEKEVGTEEIIDGIKYIYSEPYGLSDAKEIYIFTPQAPIKELPEGFRSWVGYMHLSDLEDEYLPFYGLYNVETESGFSSYEIED